MGGWEEGREEGREGKRKTRTCARAHTHTALGVRGRGALEAERVSAGLRMATVKSSVELKYRKMPGKDMLDATFSLFEDAARCGQTLDF